MITNYPNGFSGGVSIFGLPILNTYTGKVFWVDSGIGSNNNSGKTKEKPFKTLAYAISKCRSGAGDVIMINPGHIEDLTSAGAINCDKGGISIIGLGNGSDRPTFTAKTTANATFAVSANNVYIANIRVTTDVDELITFFNVTGANCQLVAVDYFETASNKNCISFLTTSTSASGLVLRDCVHVTANAPNSNAPWIKIVGGNGARIMDNQFYVTMTNNAGSNAIGVVTTAATNILIKNNVCVVSGGANSVPIALVASTTGFVVGNYVASPKTNIAGSIAIASCFGALNYASHTVNRNGILDPVADS